MPGVTVCTGLFVTKVHRKQPDWSLSAENATGSTDVKLKAGALTPRAFFLYLLLIIYFYETGSEVWPTYLPNRPIEDESLFYYYTVQYMRSVLESVCVCVDVRKKAIITIKRLFIRDSVVKDDRV